MGELELAPGILEWPKHNAEQHLAAFLPLPHFAHFPHFPHFRPLNSEKGGWCEWHRQPTTTSSSGETPFDRISLAPSVVASAKRKLFQPSQLGLALMARRSRVRRSFAGIQVRHSLGGKLQIKLDKTICLDCRVQIGFGFSDVANASVMRWF